MASTTHRRRPFSCPMRPDRLSLCVRSKSEVWKRKFIFVNFFSLRSPCIISFTNCEVHFFAQLFISRESVYVGALLADYNSIFILAIGSSRVPHTSLGESRAVRWVDSDVVTPNNISTTSSCHTSYKLRETLSLHKCVVSVCSAAELWLHRHALCISILPISDVLPARRGPNWDRFRSLVYLLCAKRLNMYKVHVKRSERISLFDARHTRYSKCSHRSPLYVRLVFIRASPQCVVASDTWCARMCVSVCVCVGMMKRRC